jgi:uncharacterized small protein (DUF1192 family)
MSTQPDNPLAFQLANALAEIERLKADNEKLWRCHNVQVQAECERLRAQIERDNEACRKISGFTFTELAAEHERLRAEIARLKAERDEWSKLYRSAYGHDWDKRGNYDGF